MRKALMAALGGLVILAAMALPAMGQRVESPSVTETRRVPGRVEFISTLTPVTDRDIRVGAAPFNPGGSQDPTLTPFTTRSRVYARVQQRGGRWVEGWLPAGTTLFCRFTGERDGYREYRPIEVAKCGNPIEGVVVREYPERIETVVRERVVVVVRETVPPPPTRAHCPTPVYGQPVHYPAVRNRNINRNVNVNVSRYRSHHHARYRQHRPPPRPVPPPRPPTQRCKPGGPARR